MYIHSKPCLNYFKQWMQQGNNRRIKILGRSKIGRYNVGLDYSGGKLRRNKWGNNNYSNNNKEDNNYNNNNNSSRNNNIEKDNNKDKWGGGDREIRL